MRRSADPILVIANWRDLSHPEAGGAEVVCEEMATRLAAKGHRVQILAARVAGRPRSEERKGYGIRRAGGRFTVYLHTLLWLFIHRRRVDIVLDSQNGIPFFTPLVVRRRTTVLLMIWHVHQEQFSAYFPKPVAAVGRWLETAGCRAVYGQRMVIAASPSTRRGVRRDLKLRGDIRVIPAGWSSSTATGVDRFPRTAAPTIVSVGRLVAHKRTDLTVRAMTDVRERFPDVVLHVVGSGQELDALRTLADRLGLRDTVRFHPDCSDEDRDRLVSSAWMSVNASAGEGWGISVIEANALGVPVLAFRRPGLVDSIRDGITGWLIEDDEPLGAAVNRALSELADERTSDRFSHEAVRWAQSFTWTAAASKLSAAIAVEASRLRQGQNDHRRQTDLASIVHVPHARLPRDWTPKLRTGDGYRLDEDGATIFLAGTDTAGARTAMERIGLPEGSGAGRVVVRVARGSDHLLHFEPIASTS